MTWEWTTLFSVIVLCGTFFFSFKQPAQKDWTPEIVELRKLYFDVTRQNEELKQTFSKMTETQENIEKLADDTKKMLSQQNLAHSLRR